MSRLLRGIRAPPFLDERLPGRLVIVFELEVARVKAGAGLDTVVEQEQRGADGGYGVQREGDDVAQDAVLGKAAEGLGEGLAEDLEAGGVGADLAAPLDQGLVTLLQQDGVDWVDSSAEITGRRLGGFVS